MRLRTILPALLLALGVLAQDDLLPQDPGPEEDEFTSSVTAIASSTATATVSTAISASLTATDDPASSTPSATSLPDNNDDDSDSDDSDDDDAPETRCTANDYVRPPFCLPKNLDVWRIDGEYYVTWNPEMWSQNSSVLITLNYLVPGGAGPIAAEYTKPNSLGYIAIHPSPAWLLNQTLLDEGEESRVTNQTLRFFITSDSVSDSGARNQFPGPTIVLMSEPTPTPIDTSPSNRPPPSTFGLAIGLPLIFIFILAAVCGTHFCMRRRRQIGPIAIGGRRKSKKGYTGRDARRARTRENEGYRDAVGDGWEMAAVKGGREEVREL